ncbi:MAG: hypothetical protein ACLT98_09620 [Eggerthellaceae bacterium]
MPDRASQRRGGRRGHEDERAARPIVYKEPPLLSRGLAEHGAGELEYVALKGFPLSLPAHGRQAGA